MPDLFAWLKPGSTPPHDVFLKAVDVVLEDVPEELQARHQRVRLAVLRETKRQRDPQP
jgi:hypothetical protein